MAIWHKPATLEQLNYFSRDTLVAHLGIEFTDMGDDYLCATMPVASEHKQPMGLLHGGASVVLAETLGSMAAYLCCPEGKAAVGQEINANHLRAVRDGFVTGTVRPLHIGRSSQVWDIRVTDSEQRLVCASRLTLAVINDTPRAR